jgi:unsaturated chondroitin disaccharide hydrolase
MNNIQSVIIYVCLLASPVHADAVMERLPGVFERARGQFRMLMAATGEGTMLPRTIDPAGELVTVKPEDWTSGFFPGSLWLVHEYDKSAEWRDHALAFTRRLESIRHFKGNHDGGFMLGCSYGNALRLSPADEHRAVLRDAAAALATRYNPAIGMIRSWDFGPFLFPVIIDNMMNLELLAWASSNGGDADLLDIAVSHANRTSEHHFRPDGSAYHVADFDPEKGWLRACHAWQGRDVRTAWARGQAWALYGFTMMHRVTGQKKYLEQALGVSRFVMDHPNLPVDKIPCWDFGMVAADGEPRDASAAAIMASGLIELSTMIPPVDGGKLRDFAAVQLRSLSAAPYLAEGGSNAGFLLRHSTGNLPEGSEIDVPLNYADYYFLEALLRYRAIKTGSQRPNLSEVK